VPVIALEVVLGFVVPVGWGVWELMSLRRERERDRLKAQAKPDDGAVKSSAADDA
jgi:hypothetical protein